MIVWPTNETFLKFTKSNLQNFSIKVKIIMPKNIPQIKIDIGKRLVLAIKVRGKTPKKVMEYFKWKHPSSWNSKVEGHITVEFLYEFSEWLEINLLWLYHGDPYDFDHPKRKS